MISRDPKAQSIIVILTPVEEAGISTDGRTELTLFKARAGQSGRHANPVESYPGGRYLTHSYFLFLNELFRMTVHRELPVAVGYCPNQLIFRRTPRL